MSRPGRSSETTLPHGSGGQHLRTAVVLVGAICLLLLMAQQWLGALGAAASAALMAWLGRPATGDPNNSEAQSGDEGHRLMAAKVVPAWGHQLDAIHATLQDGSAELLTSFSTMLSLCDELQTALTQSDPNHPGTAHMKQLAAELQTQCEKSLHGLQFGDRISQMVEILNQDTQRYVARVPMMGASTAEDAQQWLDTFEARFTTEEQRRHHHGQPPPPHQEKVDFF